MTRRRREDLRCTQVREFTDPIFDTGAVINSPVSGIQVIGDYIQLIAGGVPEGYVLNFTKYSAGGSLFVTAGKNPAWWSLAESNGPCSGQSVNAAILQPARLAHLVCVETSLNSSSVSPQSFKGNFSPQVTIMTNTLMDFTYGPPNLTISSATGDIYYDQTPDWYNNNTLIVNPGNIPTLYDDVYYVIVGVRLPDGSLGSIGSTTVSTYGNPYGSDDCGLPPPEYCN
jgi:hypothetical protein